jgi:exopolyphosphatase / guanosine-5'-triphosphate,3'-diphosphate pyrophosphatase
MAPQDGIRAVTAADRAIVSTQLGRPVRGHIEVAHRCPCGNPDVVATEPQLPDGTPFPTHFYLTCPRATAAVSTLESEGLMVRFTERLAADADFAALYAAAHVDFLSRRDQWGTVPHIADVSAGGMPDRVKCLHALVAHSLAAGPGVNPVGDEVLAILRERRMWPTTHSCVEPPRRVAAIDCGTNSIRLLIAEHVDGALREIDRQTRIVRLGQGIDTTGVIAEAALERTFAACAEYAQIIDAVGGVSAIRFVATSASRDARNRGDFVAGVHELLGVEPEVITGAEEAELSFVGAVSSAAIRPAATPRLVVDIGGGSTEFVLGDDTPQQARSVDIGCVRLTERYLMSDPPTAAELAALAAEADRAIALAAQTVPLEEARSLIGLAGTVTTVAVLALELDSYDPRVVHGARISASQVHEVAAALAEMTLDQRLQLPLMHPGRADVIVSGATILSRIVSAVNVTDVVVSEHDILDGVALGM